MALIKVDSDGQNKYATTGGISFAFVSAPEDGRKQVREFVSCRDYMNDCMIQYIHGRNDRKAQGFFWREDKNAPLDLDHLKLLFSLMPIFISKPEPVEKEPIEILRNRLYSAKRAINMYESLAGFKKKSVLTKVKVDDKKVPNCWMLTGPKEWMKSSHLVSMITLIFRVIVYEGGFEEFTTLNEVENRFEELCQGKKQLLGNFTDLGGYLPQSYKKFRMLMVKYDELFGRFAHEELNPRTRITSWHNEGGIRSFCTFSTGVKKIDDRTSKMWKTWQNTK